MISRFKGLSFVVLFSFQLMACKSVAQKYSVSSKKAIKLFELANDQIRARQFDPGIVSLEKALKTEPNFVEAHLKLGSVRKLFGDDERAMMHYKTACELKPEAKDMGGAYYTLAAMYFKQGDYQNARNYYDKTLKYPPNNLVTVADAARSKANCEFAIRAIANPVNFNPKLMDRTINSGYFQSYPVLTADQAFMIFTKREAKERNYDENIFISMKSADGSWIKPVPISRNINTRLNEGTTSISADGKTIVYTSCNKKGGVGGCDLYISYKEGNEWSVPENMGKPVNSPHWESEPSLSADGKTLYFTSVRPGGMGGDDIWRAVKTDTGWSVPENLGPGVNTPDREVSPFIHANGQTLFFASTGYPGMGGFDLYKSELTDTGWGKPANLGYPINSQDNEASMFITADFTKGYFAKYEQLSRTESRSLLYEFDVPKAISSKRTSTYAKGKVYDADTKLPISADIKLININNGNIGQRVNSDAKLGTYLVVLTEGNDYALLVKKEGYLTHNQNFNYESKFTFDPVALDIYLKPLKKNSAVVLNNVFFESGKYELQNKSRYELNAYAQLLKDNPSIKVEISGHTDNVGNPSDNLKLSNNRAKSVYNYLIDKGIDESRLRYKGYGETRPVEKNDTEEGKAKNRRIEFKLL